jgi:hypothetical protein
MSDGETKHPTKFRNISLREVLGDYTSFEASASHTNLYRAACAE